MYINYNVSLENRSDQVFVTLFTLSIYCSVHTTQPAGPNPLRDTHGIYIATTNPTKL